MLPSTRKATVLVVEDDHAVREMSRAALTVAGYAVVVEDGIDALKHVELDQQLRDVPVLILTGATLTPAEEALIARDRGYVFYKSENLETIAYHLDRLTG